MKNKNKILLASGVLLTIAALIIGIFLSGSPGREKEPLRELMKDAVLHEADKISLFGLIEVNPAVISAFFVTASVLLIAALIRIFVIPKFKYIPGTFQSLLEQVVEFFDNTAKTNSPHHNTFLGAYIFGAGAYIFLGTLLELIGIQVVTISGASVSLPAPLADINGAISMGCISYLVILGGGIAHNGLHGVGSTLKEFSLPISMSFRLFGALLSGLLVSELVYYSIYLSFLLPVVVGVLFTLLHALIQTYVLTMLTSVFYGEVSEPRVKKKSQRAGAGGNAATGA